MPWYSVFIFIFCLELMVRKKLDENDFHHYYGISFESTSLKLPQLCLKFFCNSWEVLWQQNSKWRLTVEDFTDISIGTNYFLSKFLETKINRIIWKITYIILHQDISLVIVCFVLSQINLVFKFNIKLFR